MKAVMAKIDRGSVRYVTDIMLKMARAGYVKTSRNRFILSLKIIADILKRKSCVRTVRNREIPEAKTIILKTLLILKINIGTVIRNWNRVRCP